MKTNLLLLTDRWKAKIKELSDEASAIDKRIQLDSIEMPATPRELAENTHGYAAGYAAARKELLEELDVCYTCVGEGYTAPNTGTSTMRVVCWRCDGSGLESTWKNKLEKTHPTKHSILPIVQ